MHELPDPILALAPNGDPGVKSWYAGTHRVASPAATLTRLEGLLPVFGITRLAGLTGLDRVGIPVVMSVRPASRAVAVSLGKGADLDAAKASAIMEAAEAWHAERITLPVKYASRAEIEADHRLIDVERLPRRPGQPLRSDVRLLWIEGRELFSGDPLWLPYEIVHTDYTLPWPPGSGLFAASSNGLASGNHLFEAIAHGLCEVIERDAVAKWQRLDPRGRAARRLRLETIADPGCRDVVERLRAAELEPIVWDITSDIGLAAFACSLIDRREAAAHPGFGAGCHPCSAVALARALLEAAQVRLTYIAGARDDLSRADFAPAALARKRRALALVEGEVPARDFAAVPDVRLPTLAADVAHLLGELRRAGYDEAAFVDLARADIGLAVVRVVVPGLEIENGELGGSRRRLGEERNS